MRRVNILSSSGVCSAKAEVAVIVVAMAAVAMDWMNDFRDERLEVAVEGFSWSLTLTFNFEF